MNQLTRYLAWAERTIARVVVAEGVHVGCAAITQGPMNITFRLRLLRPNRQELARLLALGPTLAQALSTQRVRITDSASGVLVEVPSPCPRTPTAEELARCTRSLGRVALGLDAFRRPVYLDLAHTPHLLAVGPTRRGKTEAIKSLVYSLAAALPPRKLTYLILAKKAAAWRAFAPAAGCCGVISEDGEIESALAWLTGEVLQQRAAEGIRTPALFLVADDLANIAARANVGAYLGELASMGGEFGLHLLLSTQTTGRAGGLSVDLEANLTARLVFGATDAAAAARYAGAGGTGADVVGTAPGDALLILDGTPQRIATAYADDRAIAMLPAGETPQPWRNRQNQQNHRHPTPHGEGARAPHEGEAAEPPPEPFDLGAPITPAEREHVAALYARLGSLSAACREAYGSKNGKTWERLKEALSAETATAEKEPDEIDLSTDAGRAAFAELQRAGLLSFTSEVQQ